MNQNLQLPRLGAFFFITFLFSTLLPAQAPTFNCPGNATVIGDESDNDNPLWNAANWYDPVINSHNLADANAPLSLTATSHCATGSNLHFRYILSLDLDQNDTFETFIDSDSLPGTNKVYFGNNPNHLFSGTPFGFDTRLVLPSFFWGFDIATTADSNTVTGKVCWTNGLGSTTNAQLPYGNHKITWIVTDDCGTSATCAYTFTIKDTKNPVAVCKNGLSVNLFNNMGGTTQLWALDFLQYTEDNYTPNDKLTLGIRRTGTGTGFPFNPDGTIQTSVIFNCDDLGTQDVELWSMDKAGNTHFCNTYVLIQDNLGVCSMNTNYGGYIRTEDGEGISNVVFELVSMNNGFPNFSFFSDPSDSTGFYSLNNIITALPIVGSVFPTLEQDPLNGVNVWDLVLMSKHILGQSPLTTPYKLISADANRSGTVTTFDIVELRKLILGTYTELPNNDSWRFVRSSQIFSNPANPFADTLQESCLLSLYNLNTEINFIGCKIGDVDGSAAPNFQEPVTDDRFYDVSSFWIKDQKVAAGQTFTVHVQSPADLEGLQMTLAAKGLRLNKVVPGPTVDGNNFGVFPGENTEGFAPVLTAAFEGGPVAFDLTFTALADGDLSDMLTINSDITPASGFLKNGNRTALVLQFIQHQNENHTPSLLAVSPNPFKEFTQTAFTLPQETAVNMTVTDQNGRVIISNNATYPAGFHPVTFYKHQFPASGVYTIRLQTETHTDIQKILFIQ